MQIIPNCINTSLVANWLMLVCFLVSYYAVRLSLQDSMKQRLSLPPKENACLLGVMVIVVALSLLQNRIHLLPNQYHDQFFRRRLL
jgi:choline-glycine betaine transporter